MRRLNRTALLVLSVGLLSGASGPDRIVLPTAREVFDVELPKACILNDRPGPDFEVFYVTCRGVDYGGIYVGNYADPSTPRSRLIKTGFCTWPSTIQVWSDVVPKDQEQADSIANSVKVRAPTSAQTEFCKTIPENMRE